MNNWGGGGGEVVLHISVGHSPTPLCIVEFLHVVDTGVAARVHRNHALSNPQF